MALKKYRGVVVGFVITALVGFGFVAADVAFAGDCSGLPPITGADLTQNSVYPPTPSALQNNPTGFGDSRPDTLGGNELNQLYLANNSANLYVGVTGNLRADDTNQNTILIFIDTDNMGGPTALDVSGIVGSNALRNMDLDNMTPGVKLDFDPEYCIAIWNDQNVYTALRHNLTNPSDVGVTIASIGGTFAFTNDNTMGVTEDLGLDPQTAQAATAVNGFEVRLPLAQLGPLANNATINVQVLLASGGGFMSNQSLPPLGQPNGGVANVGNHNPAGDPPNDVDFTNEARFPGTQNTSFTLNPSGLAPTGSINGQNIPTRYGTNGMLKATQNNHTGFGNATPFAPPTEGSELDQLFVKADFTKLYVGITGNVPAFGDNRNTVMLFLDVPDNFLPGVNDLAGVNTFVGGPGGLQMMGQGGNGGFTFDPGFSPEWVIMYWRQDNAHQGRIQDLRNDEFLPLNFSITPAQHTGGSASYMAANLSNVLGVNSIAGDDPIRQTGLADGTLPDPDAAPTTGVQFSLLWDDLGVDFGGGSANVKMMACVVNGTGFISNQFLPPLNPTVLTPMNANASFSDAPLPLAIPDNTGTPATDTRTVDMSGAGIDRVTDINVTVSISHPDISQLGVALRHVGSARQVQLKQPGSGMGANLNVTYDSDGGMGTVQPSETLLTFNGVDPNDDWQLIVSDGVTGQTGTINSWSIAVTEYTGGNVANLGVYDAIDNDIDLGAEEPGMRFGGNQYLDLNVTPTGAPSGFTGSNIPSSFGAMPLTTQNNYTGFGDAVPGVLGNVPGSELDQIRIKNTSDRLQVAVTGNLEGNGNVYVLLLDTDQAGGGFSTIPVLSTPPPAMNGIDGLTLDAGFTPNYALVVGRDPTAGVPVDDFNVFLKNINTNVSRTIGRLIRNSADGTLQDAIPNQNGSELDALFIQNDASKLYLGITGNLEANGNTWVILLQTTAMGSGTNILESTDVTAWPKPLRGMRSDRMDIGFQPDFAIVMQRSGGNYSAQLVDLLDLPPGVTITNLTFSSTYPPGPNAFAGDNTNAFGVSSDVAHDTAPGMAMGMTVQQENALTALRGVQFSIARSSLMHDMGSPPADGAEIKISALLVNNGGGGAVPSTYYSNQFLPPIDGGTFANLTEPPPPGRPTTFIDLSNETIAPGSQFYSYTLATSGAYAVPATFNGQGIPAAMGTPKSIQENYTQFGNAVLVNPGNPNCMQVAMNNDNTDGVTGASATMPETATTGMEFDIPFADIGLTPLDPETGPFVEVKVMVALTGSGGFFSNQILPPLNRSPAAPNLGNIVAMNPVPGASWLGNLSDEAVAPGVQYLSYSLLPFCGEDPADINGDGMFTTADIDAFVGVLLGTVTDPCPVQKANVNNNASTNGLDVQAFINVIPFIP